MFVALGKPQRVLVSAGNEKDLDSKSPAAISEQDELSETSDGANRDQGISATC